MQQSTDTAQDEVRLAVAFVDVGFVVAAVVIIMRCRCLYTLKNPHYPYRVETNYVDSKKLGRSKVYVYLKTRETIYCVVWLHCQTHAHQL